jgi:hypothetical protein
MDPPSAGAEYILRNLRAPSSDSLQGGIGERYARVEAEVAIAFYVFEATFQFRKK